MKKTSLYGAMALSLLFTACQSDDISTTGPNDIPTDGERTIYVNLAIHTGTSGLGSRAAQGDGTPVYDGTNPTGDDFDNGTAAENAVKKAYFVFYDQNGAVVGGEPIEVDLTNAVWDDKLADNTVDKYYKSVVGVTVGNGQENPSQVICYLNPQDPSSLSKSLSEIQDQRREALTATGGDYGTSSYFSMSNSVYYTSTVADAPQIAVQIAPNQLFNTRTAAEAAVTAGNTVDIYVERYASKLTFTSVDPTKYETVSRAITGSDTDVELTFVPRAWMLNASCTKSFVVKSFREETATGGMLSDNYGYVELNDIINKDGGDWNWNNSDYTRSYWGMSPAYFTGEYPEVSADAVKLDDEGKLNQHYYSYNELIKVVGEDKVKELNKGFEVSTTNGTTEYVHETTVGSKALASKNIVAALPSIILVGDYTVKIGSQTLTDTDFYTYGVVSADVEDPKAVVYFDAVTLNEEGNNADDVNLGLSAITGGESILRALIKQATNIYKEVEEEDAEGNVTSKFVNYDMENEDDIRKLVAIFKVAYPSDNVKGGLKVPERYRTLQLRDGVVADQLTNVYIGTTEGYMKIAGASATTPDEGQITRLTANQELMKTVGFAAKYNAGAAYFNIPVKHFGWYRAANTNKNAAEMNWSKVRVGDFGIVRNHSYNVSVSEIIGLGTGIGDPNNPIVPPAQENRYYVAYSVNILKWAVVPTQNVKL